MASQLGDLFGAVFDDMLTVCRTKYSCHNVLIGLTEKCKRYIEASRRHAYDVLIVCFRLYSKITINSKIEYIWCSSSIM